MPLGHLLAPDADHPQGSEVRLRGAIAVAGSVAGLLGGALAAYLVLPYGASRLVIAFASGAATGLLFLVVIGALRRKTVFGLIACAASGLIVGAATTLVVRRLPIDSNAAGVITALATLFLV